MTANLIIFCICLNRTCRVLWQ